MVSATIGRKAGPTATIGRKAGPTATIGRVTEFQFAGREDITTDLIAWWGLDEESGTRVDKHGSNDLADNNTVGFATGKQNNAAQFVHDNAEYLSIADNTDLSMGDIDFAIAVWVYPDSHPTSGAGYGLVTKDAAGNGDREWSLQMTSNERYRFGVSSDGTAFTPVDATSYGTIQDGTWVFIVIQHDSVNDQITIRVNHGTVDSKAHSAGVYDGTTAFNLGRFSLTGTTEHDGRLDEVAVWKRLLTEAEQKWLYNDGDGRPYIIFG